jgi:hypothetical protein
MLVLKPLENFKLEIHIALMSAGARAKETKFMLKSFFSLPIPSSPPSRENFQEAKRKQKDGL